MSPKTKSKPPAAAGVTIHIDGAARGNPGPAGVGVAMAGEKGRTLAEIALYLGETTNNVAETCALIIALQEVIKRKFARVTVFTDSELLAFQVNGTYRVKDKQLQWLHVLIRHLLEGIEHFEIRHIPRTENKQADRLANCGIEQHFLL